MIVKTILGRGHVVEGLVNAFLASEEEANNWLVVGVICPSTHVIGVSMQKAEGPGPVTTRVKGFYTRNLQAPVEFDELGTVFVASGADNTAYFLLSVEAEMPSADAAQLELGLEPPPDTGAKVSKPKNKD